MASEAFSFETLSKQEASERKAPRLTKLEPTFWKEMWDYLDALETSYLKAHAENPAARKTILLSDELRNAMRKAEGLWEARQRKVTFHAMKTGRQDGDTRPENLTREEAGFYDRLVELFRENHARVFAPRHGRPEPPVPAAKPSAPAPAPAAKPAAGAEKQPAKPAADEDIATVRALVDIPPFVGLDAKTYRLKKGEVATIPRKMADILRKNGKVASVT